MTVSAIVFDAYGTLYDTQSVAQATEAAFPGHGDAITQVWRLKQLEYSWLRSLMGRYADFRAVTEDALAYALDGFGLAHDAALRARLTAGYDRLSPYPDAEAALEALSGYRRVIFSNGSPDMLRALVGHSGFGALIQEIVSVDGAGAFKPDPRAYALVAQQLGVVSSDVLFVSSNGFDVAGAKSFGFRVARVARPAARAAAGTPRAMFGALRGRAERLGFEADFTVASLGELPALAAAL